MQMSLRSSSMKNRDKNQLRIVQFMKKLVSSGPNQSELEFIFKIQIKKFFGDRLDALIFPHKFFNFSASYLAQIQLLVNLGLISNFYYALVKGVIEYSTINDCVKIRNLLDINNWNSLLKKKCLTALVVKINLGFQNL